MIGLTGVLAAVAIAQALLFLWQLRMVRRSLTDSKTAADAAKMAAVAAEASIVEMGRIAVREQRAYLSISFGGVVPQDRETAYRFEVRMKLKNDGKTPAYNVTFRTAADVLPMPLPDDFGFPLPDVDPNRSVSVIGPDQDKVLTAVIGRLLSDSEVEQLKKRPEQGFYIWGQVNYDDAFGVRRVVRFCQTLAWMSDGSAMSRDTSRYNESD
jgi:hypothetical protein